MSEIENRNNTHTERVSARIPARVIAIVIGASILIVAVILLVTMKMTTDSFNQLKKESVDYLRLRDAAVELQAGSDQLTDQVRHYVVAGNRKYLDGYFEEANITKQRDHAVEVISREAAGTRADQYLQEAMQCSRDLMEREYYAMCLVLAAQGDREEACADHPELESITLTGEDAALSQEEQMAKALIIVMDESYEQEKTRIEENIALCLDDLLGKMFDAQEDSSERLDSLLQFQTILLFLLLLQFLIFVLFVHFSVFSPMRKAIKLIRDDSYIPEEGGREFRYLAKALNELHEENVKKTGKLAFESTHDPVTGVFNRAGYEHLMEEVDLSRIAFLLVDVDLFKQVNDTHGHETGDRILAEVATALLGHFRPQDYICRIGGDEFVVIANHIDRNRAGSILQKIDQINQSLRETEPEITVSISAGIAFGREGETPDEIFQKADKALYEVKRSIRGRAELYREDT